MLWSNCTWALAQQRPSGEKVWLSVAHSTEQTLTARIPWLLETAGWTALERALGHNQQPAGRGFLLSLHLHPRVSPCLVLATAREAAVNQWRLQESNELPGLATPLTHCWHPDPHSVLHRLSCLQGSRFFKALGLLSHRIGLLSRQGLLYQPECS